MKKEKLLIISCQIPYPIVHGGAIAQFFFLKQLVTFYDITFCTIASNKNQKEKLKGLTNAIPNLNIVYYEQIDKIIFKTILANKIFRIATIIKKKVKPFLSKMLGKKHAVEKNYVLDNSFGYASEGFTVFLSDLINKGGFNLIQLEFFETISLLPLLPKHIRKIFIHHEIRSRRNSLINIPKSVYINYLVESTKIIETAYLNIADKIVVFNQNDKQYLSELNSKVCLSPFGIPNELIIKESASVLFNKFIFIGGEGHFPNKEALEWFLDRIYIPNVNKIEWPIYVVGNWSEKTIKKYSEKKTIFFTGFVENLKDIYDNSVMLTPNISGSGIRTKILHSFANKLPVMSTKFASEGLFENSPSIQHIIHFETEIDFLKEFNKMRYNMDYLTSVANEGFGYFSNYFNSDDLLQKRINVYNDTNY